MATGQWLRTQIENGRQLSSNATTQQVATIDLPRSNFLGALYATLRILGVGTPTLTLDRVRVIANGSIVVWDTEGGELRGINKFENGTVPNGTAISTTDLAMPFMIGFGRYTRDERVILPAKAFKSLQLQITFTPGAGTSVTTVSLDLASDEYVSDMAIESVMFRRVTLVQTIASAANQLTRQKLPLGNFLRAIYLHTDDLDNIGANGPVQGGTNGTTNQVRVLVNNGAEIPFSVRADMLRDINVQTYRFDDGDTPDSELSNAAAFTGTEEMVKIDFDVDESMAHVLDTSRYNELTVEFQAAGSGTSGDTAIIMEELVAVA